MAKKKFQKQNVLGFMTETAKLDDDALIKDNIKILAELKPYIFPLTPEEFQQLEKNIIEEGCRDPLVIWKKGDMDFVLVDGHNRFEICSNNQIDFKVEKKSFESIDEVKDWMINNQLGRRNLTPEQAAILRGRLYNRMKKSGEVERGPRGQFVPSVNLSSQLAEKHNVSDKTIKRDGLFADGMEAIKMANPEIYNDILSRKEKVKRAEIEQLGKQVRADEKFAKKLVIKSVADINKKSGNVVSEKAQSPKKDKVIFNREKLIFHARNLQSLGISKSEIKRMIDGEG